jgi:hypothetical protein
MTDYLEVDDSWQQLPFATESSSRPEESWAFPLTQGDENAIYPAAALRGSVALPFVIPSG